jgi:hypothetical protein
MTHYIVERIGAEFSDRAIKNLGDVFSSKAAEGYKLHTVFPVVRSGGCLGGSGGTTYLAVYVKESDE